MKALDLYDQDFAEWARTNAELLRAGRFSEVDLEHVAEEIADLGIHQRHRLYSRFVRLIEHLLNWNFQPERRRTRWRRTIVVQRVRIERILKENPSFRPTLPEVAGVAYRDAVKLVSAVIQRPQKEFPKTCPFSIEQLLDETFLPELQA